MWAGGPGFPGGPFDLGGSGDLRGLAGSVVTVVRVVQVVQEVRVVTVRMISLYNMNSENIWFSFHQIIERSWDVTSVTHRRKVEKSAVYWQTRNRKNLKKKKKKN